MRHKSYTDWRVTAGTIGWDSDYVIDTFPYSDRKVPTEINTRSPLVWSDFKTGLNFLNKSYN